MYRYHQAACTAFLFASCAHAAPVPITDPTFMQAAVVVAAFDRYAADCVAAGGFSHEQTAIIDQWQSTQQVDLIRRRLPQLDAHPAQGQQVANAVQAIVSTLATRQIGGCPAAVSVTRLQEAQFARVAPQLLIAEAAPAPAPVPDVSAATTLAAIDSFGFHTRPKMGYGGFIALDIFPVVLLRSGELLMDVRALRFPGGLPAHRAAHPGDWAQWRRQGVKVELLTEKGWVPLAFPKTHSGLPQGLVLDGLFREVGGTGNLAVGGSAAVAVWDDYRFHPDGRVERSGGAGSASAFGDTSVATGSSTPQRQGRYRIDGLTLDIEYADGSRAQHILITDPGETGDIGDVIWIDGAAYVRRKGA